ncbi:uncharacterized protein LOC129265389 [Lytechinus pictus]|uniref:uncharacterized protein LOC129265389 n=1 Tax=Lytechinus pictus TaxID=7653 RepID=UPI0030B9F929
MRIDTIDVDLGLDLDLQLVVPPESANKKGEDGADVNGREDESQRCLPLKKRHPTCARCRNHGLIVDLKGHKHLCEYRDCLCTRCNLVIQRRVVMAKQVALSREQLKQQRQDHSLSQQLQVSQGSSQGIPSSPTVIDLISESTRSEERANSVVQLSPDSTNIEYNSPYSSWDSPPMNLSQPTQMTLTPQKASSQASRSSPTSFQAVQESETYRPRMVFLTSPSNRSLIPHPVVPYPASAPRIVYNSDNIPGASAFINYASSQGNFDHALEYSPTSYHTPQLNEMYRPQPLVGANQMARPFVPSPTIPMASDESINQHIGYIPSQTATYSANLSSAHGVTGQTSEYPLHPRSTFHSSLVDETYRCQVSITSNYPTGPVFHCPMVPHQPFDAVSAYRDSYMLANSQVASSSAMHIDSMSETQPPSEEATDLSNIPYCQVKEHADLLHQIPLSSSLRVSSFVNQSAQNFMPAQEYYSNPDRYTSCSLPADSATAAYLFQTGDKAMLSSENDISFQGVDLTRRPQIDTTPLQPEKIHLNHADGFSSRSVPLTTTQQEIAVNISKEPTYKSRRPFPLRITIPSLNLSDRFTDSPSPSPMDPSPTFTPSNLSILTNTSLPTSDIPSPGFFTASLPSFNYPSPTLPTQSSPVFSYPSPYTNPSKHAGLPSFQSLTDSILPVTQSSRLPSNFAEQVRIPPKYDEDFDNDHDHESDEIDVCSLNPYAR